MYVAFSPNGRYRVTAVNADASTELTIEDAQTRAPIRLTGLPEGDITGVRFDPAAGLAAFTVVSDTSPADVFVADLSTGQARRLTHALNPAIKESDLIEASIVRYPGEGGVQVPAVLYRPKGASAANPAPAVVLVHGGPGGQTRRGYSAMVQHLVNHGYAVLGANNRGSSGYGKTFFHMDDKKHGEADLRDIVAGGDWLRAQDWVADDQVAVMGGSYGGYITAAALAFHPEKFEAGIDIFGVTNWVRTLQSIPPGGAPSAWPCSTRWATRRSTPSATAPSRPCSTPTRFVALCWWCRAPTTRACFRSKATNWSRRSAPTTCRSNTSSSPTKATASSAARTASPPRNPIWPS